MRWLVLGLVAVVALGLPLLYGIAGALVGAGFIVLAVSTWD